MRPHPPSRPLGAALLLAVGLLGCGRDREAQAATVAPPPVLAAATPPPAKPAERPAPPIPNVDTDAVFASLPAPRVEGAEPYHFKEGVKVVPRAGEKALPFPPAQEKEKPQARVAHGELRVTRHQPDGAVGTAGVVSATFNQPMVPLAAVEELAKRPVPMSIEPKPEGAFRWLGASTVTFEPKDRLPFATTYRATLPAGVASATGEKLASAVSWSFETPRPKIDRFEPTGGREATPDQLLHLEFNQAVSPSKVAEQLACSVGAKRFALKLDKPAEDPFAHDASADVAVKRRIFEERNVYLRPVEPLPLDSQVHCVLPRGFTGNEGPNPTTANQTFAFRTYGPFALKTARCGYQNYCPPGTPFQLVFSNAVDTEQDLKERVTLEPKVDDLEYLPAGNYLTLRGSFQPETTYTIHVARALIDAHKQQLTREEAPTVRVGPADPELALPNGPLAVLERRGPRLIPLSYTGLSEGRVRYARLQPGDVLNAMELVNRSDESTDPLGHFTPAVNHKLDLGARSNDAASRGLDVDEVTGKGGAGLLLVDVSSAELHRVDRYGSTHRLLVVEVTDLGITAHLTDAKMVVLVTSLSSGKPVAGAKVELITRAGIAVHQGTTDAHGLVELSGPDPKTRTEYLLAAETADDRAVLPTRDLATGEYLSSYNGGYINANTPTVVASLFSDRSPYRPGDTVHLAGVVRVMTHGTTGGVEPVRAGARFDYEVRDSRSQKTAHGTGEVGPRGLVSLEVPLASDASLGSWSVTAKLLDAGPATGQSFNTSFSVEEFRTPEYKVSIDTGEPLHFVGEKVQAKVVGEYFFGGGMAGAKATWRVSRSRGFFTPPNPPAGYTFGEGGAFIPFEMGEFGMGRYGGGPDALVGNGEGTLDAQGRLAFDVTLDPAKLEGPVSFSFEGSVTDANRQQISANATLLAHAGRNYAGVKVDRTVIKEGESVGVQVVVEDVDGKPQETRGTTLELVEQHWQRVKDPHGGWSYEPREEKAGDCQLEAPKALGEAATCRMVVKKAGEFVVRAVAKDAQGRSNRSGVRVYAYGKGYSPWFRLDQNPTVELVADQASYAPGSTAKVLVKSPFPHSVGIVAIDREGLVEYRPIEFDGAATAIEVPLSGAQVPNVHLMVGLTRGRISPEEAGAAPGDPDDLGRPRYAGGELTLQISTREHELTVAVSPERPAIEPGGQLDVKVQTRDGKGQPTSAQLVVAVVDEGVLSLEGYALPNPLRAIFLEREAQAGNVALQPLILQRHKDLQRVTRAPGGPMKKEEVRTFGGMAGEPPPPPKAVAAAPMDIAIEGLTRGGGAADRFKAAPPKMTARTVFASTAYFTAREQTDAQGNLTLHVKMPENLTRYRIMVVAVGEGDRYGEGDGSVQVRKPVLVRPALPRFLNLGDTFLASAVLNNQTDADLWVDAQARVANGQVDAKRQRVLIRAGEAKEVAFEARAGAPGVSRWQFAAVALDGSRSNDAAELEVPVELPATAEAFATYGTTDQSLVQPVSLPKDALPDFGGLEVSLSSTALTGLADAVVYLHDYPYECVEQTASRILPFVALKQVVTDFHIQGAGTAADRDALIKAGLARILRNQRGDGGFGYWVDSRDSYLYVSAWASYVLLRAQQAGYAVDAGAMQRLTSFLEQRLRNPRHDLGEDEDYGSQAMAALTLGMLKSPQPELVKRIYGHRDRLPIYGKAWLLEAAHTAIGPSAPEVAELNRALQNAAVQKASSAHFTEATTESIRLLMHSNERTDAIVLAALIHVRPKDPLIPKVVHGLNESRRHGRWDSTQSNAWATLAMGDYYAAFERAVPHFSADLFVGDAYAGGTRFEGRTTTTVTEKIPMAVAAGQKSADLTLGKSGAGRLYYRLGLRYAPKNLKLGAEEQGFTITRTYLPMDGAPDSVTTDADGSVHIKAGSDVRVKLQIVVQDRAEFVAIDDPLPAGLEAVNTTFLTSRSSQVMQAETDETEHTWRGRGSFGGWGWWWNPFNHTELKDDRVVLFADQLPAGVYTHTYVARATAKGTFQVPPARAFEMYEPENFGHNASTVVDVR